MVHYTITANEKGQKRQIWHGASCGRKDMCGVVYYTITNQKWLKNMCDMVQYATTANEKWHT